MKHLTIIIITGLSGSGKSTALAAFEDAGFYCVDNLPVDLLPKFLELPIQRATEISGFAFVMDLREKGFLDWEVRTYRKGVLSYYTFPVEELYPEEMLKRLGVIYECD